MPIAYSLTWYWDDADMLVVDDIDQPVPYELS